MITIPKRYCRLREDSEKNYAANTDGTNDSPSKIVNNTKASHPDAQAVTISGNEMDGNSNTQTTTVNIGSDPKSLANAQKMARTFQSQGQDVNFKVNLNNGYQRMGNLIEGVTFTKKELREWLTSF